MDEPKIELPAWLPWATTACLAAMVACLVELWMIERARNQLLSDEGRLAESALKSMDSQLEAERIISRKEVENLRQSPKGMGALHVALLAPPSPVVPRNGASIVGAVVWDPVDGKGVIRVSGLPGEAPERDYQLWLDGPDLQTPARCAVFHSDTGSGGTEVHLDPLSAERKGSRFLLIEGPRGGSRTLDEAQAGGSIVLATPAGDGRISDR
jgi:Anti-sigma-K factor rskA